MRALVEKGVVEAAGEGEMQHVVQREQQVDAHPQLNRECRFFHLLKKKN